jgi:phosphoribosylaminoimidazole-succinocarboxamide synthase
VTIDLAHRYSGKVRDLYAVDDDHMLMVASDRVSVFDVILPNPVPGKGRVLTALSTWWFAQTAHLVPNHLVSSDPADFPAGVGPEAAGRSMLVKVTDPIRLECVARGYLFGSAWSDYQATGSVQGHKLPSGLRQAEQLPAALFTPTTKAEGSHDLPLTDTEAAALIGDDLYEQVRDLTLMLYAFGAEHAQRCGIVLADTKLEFGVLGGLGGEGGEVIVIDEVLTPDSSRYWPADEYQVGTSPPSFDKQFVRDHYEAIGWKKEPPAPEVPADVVAGTRARYVEAYERLTGLSFDTWYGDDT